MISVFLAGALLCAVIGYMVSFRPAPEYHFSSSATVAQTQPPLVVTENRININTATFEELKALPGIGDVIAQSILDLRKELGLFRLVEDLLLAKGLGEKKLEAIRDLIYIR